MQLKAAEAVIRDERGSITQVVSGGKWRKLNIIKRKAGSLGGGHYHLRTHELFYVMKGELEVILCQVRSDSRQSFVATMGKCFQVQPGYQHYMKFITHTTLLVLYSASFKKADADTYTDKALPALKDIFEHARK